MKSKKQNFELNLNKLVVGSAACAILTLSVSTTAMADWQIYKNITLGGMTNTIPGGSTYYEANIPSGVYRFRIDPTSVGVDYATSQAGNTKSKSAAVMVYNRTSTTNNTASVSYYGLNMDGVQAAGIIHAFPQTGGYSIFLSDWARTDNSGSVNVIIEQWAN